jgi:ABC-type glycerol-3-phosphate transport system substrate-binding protein
MTACTEILAGDGYPIAFGGLGGWLSVHWVSNFIDRIVGADAAIALFTKQAGHWSDQGVVEALEYFKTFYDSGYLGEDTVTENYSVAAQRFYDAEATMFGTGGWETAGLVSVMADQPDLDFDFVEFPEIAGMPGKSGDWIFWGEVFSGAKSRQSVPAKIRVLDALGSKEYHQVCYEIRQDQYAAIGYDEGASVEMHPLLKKMDDLYNDANALVPIPDVAMSPAAAGVLNEELTGILLDQVTIEEALANVDAALAEHDGYV